MNFSLTNARSLPPKLSSLITAFKELDLAFMMISETWITNTRQTMRNIKDLKDSTNINLICKNRKSRGGGVCVAFNTRRARLSRFPLPNSDWEVVCATGKVVGMSRKIAVFAVYLPPKLTSGQVMNFCDYLADAIELVKSKLGDRYVVAGGDINNKDWSPAFGDFPEMAVMPCVPTRYGAALDKCYCNFAKEIFKTMLHHAISNEAGTPSDHVIVSYNFKMERKHVFQVTKKMVQKFSKGATATFKGRMAMIDLGFLDGLSATDMVERFNEVVVALYDEVFPEVEVRTRSTDLTWISRMIRGRIRKKKRLYAREGKSVVWRGLERDVDVEIKQKMERYLEKVKKRMLEDGNGGAYHRAVGLLSGKEHKGWSPSQLFPDLGERDVAEHCADFFNGIYADWQGSNQCTGNIPNTKT